MKKKSIKKVITTIRDICFKNDYCTDCPLNHTICLNTTEFDDKELERVVNIIKEIIDSEQNKNITQNIIRKMD